MATLIGDGAHASDIGEVTRFVHWVAHQKMWSYEGEYVIGVNNPRERARVADEIHTVNGWYDLPWIHPDAKLFHDVEVGWGTHINYGVHIVRTRIGRHCTVSPGVTICGGVKIGDRVLIGAGATICDRVTIGSDVTVGAGAVVLPETNIPDGETWVGVPARRV